MIEKQIHKRDDSPYQLIKTKDAAVEFMVNRYSEDVVADLISVIDTLHKKSSDAFRAGYWKGYKEGREGKKYA